MSVRYIAAFRTYSWNDTVAELAARFFQSCPSAKHVVLADESKGPLKIDSYEVVSHTEDTSEYGLLVYPKGRSLWHNVDYATYILRLRFPDFEYYVTSESDLAVNASLEPIVEAIASRSIDLAAHDFRPATEDWTWYHHAKTFATPMRVLLFFMILSGRALDLLLAARIRQGSEIEQDSSFVWPFCEAFVPSVLNEAGMRTCEIGEFVDTTNLRFRPRISLSDPRANAPGTLAHSVVPDDDFCRIVINEHDPRKWFEKKSELSMSLARYPFDRYAPLMLKAFERRSDALGFLEFSNIMKEAGIVTSEHEDICYLKPSLVSSVSKWSRSKDRVLEAAGANGATVHDDFGFHTDFEDGPWWLVDLTQSFFIGRIEIVNRKTQAERLSSFCIESSANGSNWNVRHLKLTINPVSSDLANPYVVNFEPAFSARFIRICLTGPGIFHLRRVRIFSGAKCQVDANENISI